MTTNRPTTRRAEHRAPREIRILVLEEEPGDVALVEEALGADGFRPSIAAVGSRRELDAALASAPFDVFVAGAVGLGHDPFALLRTARKVRPELPLVFLSSSPSQELAVELLKAGASDFVSKNRTLELVPAIDRALWEATGARERAASREAVVQFVGALTIAR